jgi:hypothetical protein
MVGFFPDDFTDEKTEGFKPGSLKPGSLYSDVAQSPVDF